MISTYETCPLRFKLRYIDKIEVERIEVVEAFLGNRVHETLAKLHKDLILSKLTPLEDLISYYKSEWAKNWNQNILITKEGFTEENYYDTGERLISDYYKRYQPFTNIRTVATEKPLSFKLKDKYNFRGYIDRLDIRDGEIYEIHDYKTSSKLPDGDILENDRQLALYQIGLKQHYRDAENVKLIWHYLRFDKEFTIEKTEEELEEIEGKTVELIKTIETDSEFKPIENNFCEWCDFPEYCPVKKHIVKTEILPAEEFLKDDGVTLANQYVELKNKEGEVKAMEGELKAKINALKEIIVEYTYKENITQLRGSDHILRLLEMDLLKFPYSNETERAELEELIKKAGKWEEVSILNSKRLAKIILESAWDKSFLKKIVKFVRPEKEIKITVSNIKENDDE
jgi:putative RecB family exonuclease